MATERQWRDRAADYSEALLKSPRMKTFSPRLLPIFAFFMASTVSAADPAQQADWQARLERADALLAEARQKQGVADAEFTAADRACYEKFLVNRCRDEARRAHIRASREAQRIENEGRALEREVKREQLADKDRERAGREPQRSADHEARAQQLEAAQQQAEAERAARLAGKEKKAEEGARRRAAEEARLQQKRADYEARVAARMEAAARKAAEKNGE